MEYFKLEDKNGRRYHTLHKIGYQKNQTACGIVLASMFDRSICSRPWFVTNSFEGHKLCSSSCFTPNWYEVQRLGTKD